MPERNTFGTRSVERAEGDGANGVVNYPLKSQAPGETNTG